MADRRLQLPEVVVPGQRLGRNINHDQRSLRFQVARAETPATVVWERRLPVLDQGTLGRCVPTSAVGVFGTEPFYSTLPKALNGRLSDALAIEWYRLVTRADPFAGQWEPDDTGSDGLSMGKVLKTLGFISGYEHITSLQSAWAAIKKRPFITGVLWVSGMDNPSSEGIVHATGVVRGGHEFEVAEYNAARGLWGCWNAWTAAWGKGGKFYIPDEDYQKLLEMQGDATSFVPITEPAPIPSPEPIDPVLKSFPFDKVDSWAKARKIWWSKRDKAAADAYLTWRSTVK